MLVRQTLTDDRERSGNRTHGQTAGNLHARSKCHPVTHESPATPSRKSHEPAARERERERERGAERRVGRVSCELPEPRELKRSKHLTRASNTYATRDHVSGKYAQSHETPREPSKTARETETREQERRSEATAATAARGRRREEK